MNVPPATTSGRIPATGSIPLAVRLPNWVGDVCMALPALARLHGKGFALHVFGKPWAMDLLAGLPYQVHALPARLGAAAAAIRACGATQGVLFTNSFSSALAMRRAGVRAVGYANEFRGLLLGLSVAKVAGIHEVQSFWRLAMIASARLKDSSPRNRAAYDAAGLAEPPAPELGLVLTSAHRDQAADALQRARIRAPYTVLCPLAVGLVDGRAKVWPSFPLLCRGLIEEGGTVVACPGPGEYTACAAALPGAQLIDGLGLGAYAAVLAGATRVVANDSGPMHLAAAVGAPVLGVFGVSDPQRSGPWSRRAFTIGGAGGWPTVKAVWEALARVGR